MRMFEERDLREGLRRGDLQEGLRRGTYEKVEERDLRDMGWFEETYEI